MNILVHIRVVGAEWQHPREDIFQARVNLAAEDGGGRESKHLLCGGDVLLVALRIDLILLFQWLESKEVSLLAHHGANDLVQQHPFLHVH